MDHVIGIDTSTTATKAVVINQDGRVVAEGVQEYGYQIPHPGWSEQDPGLWWDATVAAIRSALSAAGIDGAAVSAVGLTGQMHALVLLDRASEVLRPAILWNDQRTAQQCVDIRHRVGAERLLEVTGNDALPG
ncbi:MAG: FGGY family carbohydrate kinase, partial [Thermomicrobiales bacterium]